MGIDLAGIGIGGGSITPVVLIMGVNVIIWGALGAFVSIEKGRPSGEGALLGALFWPVGVLVAALLPTDRAELARQRERRRRAEAGRRRGR